MNVFRMRPGFLRPSILGELPRTNPRTTLKHAILPPTSQSPKPRGTTHPFTTTPSRPRAPKSHKEAPKATSDQPSTDDLPTPNPEQPRDFADVLARWTLLQTKFEDELVRTRKGGKYNPQVLGKLPVHIDKARTFPLEELAQIVPKASGRSVSILANEPGYIKPIMSAVQKSEEFNQQPQRDEENELELHMKIELDRPEELVTKLRGACNRWRERIREVTAKREKLAKDWAKDKVVTVDVKKTILKELGVMQTKQLDAVKAKEAKEVRLVGSKAY